MHAQSPIPGVGPFVGDAPAGASRATHRMPTVEPAIDFPSPPIDRFPDATIEKPWLKAEYDPGLDAASGRMLVMTVKGDTREYRFEVAFHGSAAPRRSAPATPPTPTASTTGTEILDSGKSQNCAREAERTFTIMRAASPGICATSRSISRCGCSSNSRPSLNPWSSLAATAGPFRKLRSGVRLTQPIAAGLSSEQRASPTTPSEQGRDGCPPTVAPESWCFVIPRRRRRSRHSTAGAIGGKKRQNAGPGAASPLCLSGRAHMRKGRYREKDYVRCGSPPWERARLRSQMTQDTLEGIGKLTTGYTSSPYDNRWRRRSRIIVRLRRTRQGIGFQRWWRAPRIHEKSSRQPPVP